RNTLDCLKYIRKLKEQDIPVFFEKENINSMDAKGEVMLTIMASLAQQESQSLSQNVKLGIQYRYQQGEVQVNHNRFLGYTKDENKRLVIVPEEAEIIKRIYREYLEGSSLNKIAKGLEADGILTGAGRKKWYSSSLHKILINEKYMGDALLQKTYTVDFLSKKRVNNEGVVPQYYVENNHEAIIPKHLFMLVQEELKKRRIAHISKNGQRRNYSSNHSLAQIVFCDARTVREDDLKQAVIQAINELFKNRSNFLKVLEQNIVQTLSNHLHDKLIKVEKELEALQHSLIGLANSNKNYNDVVDNIYKRREEKQQLQIEIAEQENGRERLEQIATLLKE